MWPVVANLQRFEWPTSAPTSRLSQTELITHRVVGAENDELSGELSALGATGSTLRVVGDGV